MNAAGTVNCTARGANNILNTTAARRSCLCADDQRGYADGHSADVLHAGGHSPPGGYGFGVTRVAAFARPTFTVL
jgi:hypothetical protein